MKPNTIEPNNQRGWLISLAMGTDQQTGYKIETGSNGRPCAVVFLGGGLKAYTTEEIAKKIQRL